ncbi:hypothetical protein TBR22_A40680 [Luteitalea sp. TBR-22]|uniref:PAS domain-containing protein n=1 Tax=Luteitalea sp. TBR-22 TaxID=2802971 RepID=UPI001AF4CFDD|nr:PAS domain-containing protein [Luteitalea sp. TBR-22]BCS34842.1 hypothetical protein TBR22_A40680 [Luteitalea sp. TBR-22]
MPTYLPDEGSRPGGLSSAVEQAGESAPAGAALPLDIAPDTLLEALLSRSPCGLVLISSDGTCLALNERAERQVLGTATAVSNGAAGLQPIVSDEGESLGAFAARVLQDGAGTLTASIPSADAPERAIELQAVPWRHDDGATIVASIRDVSAQRARERVLRESEERLRLALQAARMGTYDWDIPRGRLTWSREHEELWGLAPGEFDGTYEMFASRVHPDDLPAVDHGVARCIEAREPFAGEFRVVWPDGTVRWIAGTGEFEFGPTGAPLKMRGVVREITEQKVAEARLQASDRRFRSVVEHAWDGISISREDGTLEYVSPSAARMLGEEVDRLVAHDLAERVHPADRARMESRLDEVRSTPHAVVTWSHRLRHRSGEYRWVEVTATNLLDDPAVNGIVSNFRDVTERRQATTTCGWRMPRCSRSRAGC